MVETGRAILAQLAGRRHGRDGRTGRGRRRRGGPRPVLKSIAMQPSATSLPFDSTLRARIADRLASIEARRASPDAAMRRAAVAFVIVGDDSGEACFVLTRRASGLRRHSGQWAIPGGRSDDGELPPDTARRELREEVGLDVPEGDVLGRLDDYATRSGYVISPVVCWGPPRPELALDRTEVARAHLVPLGRLLAPDLAATTAIPESDRPVLSVGLLGGRIFAPTAAVIYQAREWLLMDRATRVSHFEQPVFAWK